MALQRRRRRASREPQEAAAEAAGPRRAHREEQRRQPEETADQKLDRLLREQRAARASSLPAEDDLAVRRLAMHPAADGAADSQRGRREGSGAQQPGHHGGHHDGTGLLSALHDPRASALGLGGLQDAARQSFELLQQAISCSGTS